MTLQHYLPSGRVAEILDRVDDLLQADYGSDDLVLLRVGEVAELLGVSVPTIRRRIRSGHLRPTRLHPGDTVRISVKDLRSYLRQA